MATRAHFVKKARKEHTADDGTKIPIGTSYFWWKFNFGRKHKSLKAPKYSQLINSPFLSQVAAFKEDFFVIEVDELEEKRDQLVEEISQLLDETQDSLQNMPEHLQEQSSSGELLTERVEMLEQWKDEVEGVDVECSLERDDYDSLEDFAEAKEEWLQEKVGEIEDMDYQGS